MGKQNVQAKEVYEVFVFSLKTMINVFTTWFSSVLQEILPRLAESATVQM